MSRLFWFGLGAAAGVMATRRVNRAARHLTPGGIAEDVGDALRELAVAVGTFGADVRAGMAEREQELHRLVDERTGIPVDGRRDSVARAGAGRDSVARDGAGRDGAGRDGKAAAAARARGAAD